MASPAECAQVCTGFRYMGLQWSSQCFCDNEFGSLGAADGCGVEGAACGTGTESCSYMNAVFEVACADDCDVTGVGR